MMDVAPLIRPRETVRKKKPLFPQDFRPPPINTHTRTKLEDLMSNLSPEELGHVFAFIETNVPDNKKRAFIENIVRFPDAPSALSFIQLLANLPNSQPLLDSMVDFSDPLLLNLETLLKDFSPERLTELFKLERKALLRLLEFLHKSEEDLATLLLDASKHLKFSELLHVISFVTDPAADQHKCHLCSLKRFKRFSLEQCSAKHEAKKGYKAEPEIWVDPSSQAFFSFVPKPGGRGHELKYDNHRINSEPLCLQCIREIHTFVSEHGNRDEVYHTIGAEQKEILQRNMALSRQKAMWWQENGHKMTRAIMVLDLVLRCNRRVRLALREEDRLQRIAQRELELEMRKQVEKDKRAAIMKLAVPLDSKWLRQEACAVQKMFKTQRLYSLLQEEKELGITRPAPKERIAPASTKLTGVLFPEGTPITPEKASEIFGTLQVPIKDERDDLRTWKEQASAYETYSNIYCRQKEKELEAIREKERELRINRWKEGAKYFQDRHDRRVLCEKQEALKQQNARRQKRLECRALRDELEAESNRRLAEGRRQKEEAAKFKEDELLREGRERSAMEGAEREQCHVDSFWGLIKKQRDRERILAEFDRRKKVEVKRIKKHMKELRLLS